MEQDSIVFYHGKCPDGFGAAYSAWKVLGDSAQYVPLTYSKGLSLADLPDITAKQVFILDFSFDKDIHEEMLAKARSVQLLDHHKTAYQKLCGCKGCFFDLSRSGAMLAWQYFHSGKAAPLFIELIQDKDLWLFKHQDTKAFSTALEKMPQDFLVWQALEDEAFLQQKIAEGRLLNEYYLNQVDKLALDAQEVEIAGIRGLAVNSPSLFTSELGAVLAQKCGSYALIWSQVPQCIKCSLRSVPEFDCSQIAELFGGGGHPQASAFSTPTLEDFLKIVKFK